MTLYTVEVTKSNNDVVRGLGAVFTAAANARRFELRSFKIGNTEDPPTDVPLDYVIQRGTIVNLVGASATPQPYDPADAAAVERGRTTITTDGTFTAGAFMFKQGVNKRQPLEWTARQGQEILVPATVDTGLYLALVVAKATTSSGLLVINSR